VTRRKDADVAAEWIRGAFGWIVLALVAVLFIPVVIIAGVGFAQGTVPSADAGGIFGTGPGYPVFAPPFWLLWIPALGTLALSVATWRYRGQFMDSIFSARWDLGIVAFVGATTSLGAAVAFGAPFLGPVVATLIPWILALLVLVSRGIWDGVAEAFEVFGRRSRTGRADRGREPAPAAAAAPVPALRITADAARWQRSRQRLTLQDGDPRTLTVDVFDSATNDLGLARALVRAIEGEDAAPSSSTAFDGGPGTAVRTIRRVSARGGERVIATWHWDDGARAVLMAAYDMEPDRFADAEGELDALARGIRIGTI
jgi:hypothetical protein